MNVGVNHDKIHLCIQSMYLYSFFILKYNDAFFENLPEENEEVNSITLIVQCHYVIVLIAQI